MKGARGYFFVAIGVLIAASALRALARTDRSRRNVEIFTEMVYSPAAESFALSADLPGGTVQQHLVQGVVPRGELPLRFGLGEEEAVRAGRELDSPFTGADSEAIEQGRLLYGIYCTVCHDAAGEGRGPAVERGMVPPPSLHAARSKQMAAGQMFHILTFGQGNMKPYAAQMTREERWKVILYVRESLQGSE